MVCRWEVRLDVLTTGLDCVQASRDLLEESLYLISYHTSSCNTKRNAVLADSHL